ncbi:MAG: CRTAC1 family protein, partial [Bacteroidetes bacterium]
MRYINNLLCKARFVHCVSRVLARRVACWLVVLATALGGCQTGTTPQGSPLFKTLDHQVTGLHFANTLTPTVAFNMFKYMYFYNGAGLAAADFNNDGLIDIFFASNQGQNSLYLNRGHLRFEDATVAAKVPTGGGWSTGVSVIDINNDGMMDLYVCQVNNLEGLKGKNQLLVCQRMVNGVPEYADEAEKYGLNFSGFSTQAAFFDYDLDGDLDMYLLNHAIDHNGRFAERRQFLGTFDSLSGDRLYQNTQGYFTDVTVGSGINSNAIGYGLGIAISDVNLDGWPDIYVGNDFHENDYLYINQRNGSFADEATLRTMHTSQFSMGVDVADITNDGFPEIISLDMLPQDPYILKRSLGEDTYDIFKMKLGFGYHPYFTRNNLQLNRRNGFFSETGLYSGVAATDWSWAALWMDFDNDAKKDLFITNGIPKRLNDMDYVSFVSDKAMQTKIVNNQLSDSDFAIINNFPEIKLPNCFYVNTGNAHFVDVGKQVEGNSPTFSNGAVTADFDNDGDLDIVVNNIADAAMLYENTTNTTNTTNEAKPSQAADLVLQGSLQNRNAIGSKLVLFCGTEVMTYEKTPVHGFLSSMETPLHVGLKDQKIDSGYLIWPDNSCERITAS